MVELQKLYEKQRWNISIATAFWHRALNSTLQLPRPNDISKRGQYSHDSGSDCSANKTFYESSLTRFLSAHKRTQNGIFACSPITKYSRVTYKKSLAYSDLSNKTVKIGNTPSIFITTEEMTNALWLYCDIWLPHSETPITPDGPHFPSSPSPSPSFQFRSTSSSTDQITIRQ